MYEEESIFSELGVYLHTNAELSELARKARRNKSPYPELMEWAKDVLDAVKMPFAYPPTQATYNRLRDYMFKHGFSSKWVAQTLGMMPGRKCGHDIAGLIVVNIKEGLRG